MMTVDEARAKYKAILSLKRELTAREAELQTEVLEVLHRQPEQIAADRELVTRLCDAERRAADPLGWRKRQVGEQRRLAAREAASLEADGARAAIVAEIETTERQVAEGEAASLEARRLAETWAAIGGREEL